MFSAIYNFNPDETYKLKLNVGEAVHILQEEEDWYFGYAVQNKYIQGIFPKTFVNVIECTVDDTGPTPLFLLNQPPIVQEITTVLREWGAHWKNLYVVSKQISSKVYEQTVDVS